MSPSPPSFRRSPLQTLSRQKFWAPDRLKRRGRLLACSTVDRFACRPQDGSHGGSSSRSTDDCQQRRGSDRRRRGRLRYAVSVVWQFGSNGSFRSTRAEAMVRRFLKIEEFHARPRVVSESGTEKHTIYCANVLDEVEHVASLFHSFEDIWKQCGKASSS